MVFIIIAYIICTALDVTGKGQLVNFNNLGSILNAGFFLIFTLYTLSTLFREKKTDSELRHNPDFWFVATMFCFAFLGLVATIITDVTYKAGNNDNVLYAIFIAENLVDCLIYYGYYKGLNLVSKTR